MKTKICSKCGLEKTIDKFNRNSQNRDGFHYWCKICTAPYSKKSYDKYRLSPKGRKCRAKVQRQFAKTEKGKLTQANSRKAFRKKFPERNKVYKAVAKAVRDGLLPHPSKEKCRVCNSVAHHYHHDDYSPSHYLDVIPLCRICHGRLSTSAK